MLARATDMQKSNIKIKCKRAQSPTLASRDPTKMMGVDGAIVQLVCLGLCPTCSHVISVESVAMPLSVGTGAFAVFCFPSEAVR